MNKKIAVALATVLTVSAFPAVAFAKTDNFVTKEITVRMDTEIKNDMAPSLVIKHSADHTGDFTFDLALDGAQWLYGENGEYAPGVTYKKYTDNQMTVTVDLDTFDAKTKDIRFPLYSKVDKHGEVKVVVDGTDSAVSSGTYTFAKCINEDMAVTVSVGSPDAILYSGTINDFVISENATSGARTKDLYTLKLDNGFVFGGIPRIEGTGKFENNLIVSIDEDNKNIMYIKVLSDKNGADGKITMPFIEINSTTESVFGPVGMTVKKNDDYVSLTVAKFPKPTEEEIAITIDEIDGSTARPTITGKGTPKKTVDVYIGDVYLGKARVDITGKWSVAYPEYIAKSLNDKTPYTVYAEYVTNSNEKPTGRVKKQFSTKIVAPKKKIVLTIGGNKYTVDGSGFIMDSPAFIDKNGRTMLPMRAVAGAIGIPDSSIVWEDSTKTARITCPDGKVVSATIGENRIFVNGTPVKTDTSAVIKDGRTFLPVRALLNAIGVADSDITWDEAKQTITFDR